MLLDKDGIKDKVKEIAKQRKKENIKTILILEKGDTYIIISAYTGCDMTPVLCCEKIDAPKGVSKEIYVGQKISYGMPEYHLF